MENVNIRKLMMEVGVAIFLNIVIAVATFFFTQQLFYALGMVIFLEIIIIAFLLVQLHRRPQLVGITNSPKTFAEGPDVVDIVETVSTEFVFWGISAKSMLSNDKFRELLLRKAKGDCAFKFLLLEPTSPNVAKKALEEGDTAVGWKNEIEANIMRLKQLRDEHHLNIEIRLYKTFPVFRVIFTNTNRMYFGWYAVGLQGIRSPLLIVHNAQGTLYQPIRLSFNDLWVSSKDPFAGLDGDI